MPYREGKIKRREGGIHAKEKKNGRLGQMRKNTARLHGVVLTFDKKEDSISLRKGMSPIQGKSARKSSSKRDPTRAAALGR